MACRHGCGFIDGVHDYGCPGRREVYTDPVAGALYFTETPDEGMRLDLLLQLLLDEAGMSEWDPEAVVAEDEKAWIAVRYAIRQGLSPHGRAPVRIAWSAKAEAPALVMREG